jgi:hypothetical protein
MTNTNVLKDMKCPNCGSEGPFDMEGITVFEDVEDNGTSTYLDVKFPDGAYVICDACECEGTYSGFRGKEHWKCKNCGSTGEPEQLLYDNNWDSRCPDCCSSEIELTK